MASATGRRHLKEKTGRKGRVNGEEEEEGRRRKVPLKNEKRKRASGASRMPEEGSGRTATTVRRLRELLLCFLVFFYLLDLTGRSWAVLFFSWR